MYFAIKRNCWFGVSLFVLIVVAAASRPAQAAVVFRNLNVTLDASLISGYDLDVDLDGTTDFHFTSAFVPDPVLSVGFNQVEFPFASNNGVVIDAFTGDGFPSASLLSLGEVVSSSSLFSSSSDKGNLSFYIAPDPPTGNFAGKSGFLGFKFDRQGGISFGFAEIAVNALDDPQNPFGLTLRSVAYEDTLGGAATVSAVPEPSGLALAGAGLGLLIAFRGRKNVKKAANRESVSEN